jgi:hypothetical protein
MIKECKKHGDVKHYKRKSRIDSWLCSKCSMDAVNKRRYALRKAVIDYKGNKCERCGYDSCLAALEFHHLYGKDFGLSDGRTRSLERMKAEADKCMLVCANCHRELHAEHYPRGF